MKKNVQLCINAGRILDRKRIQPNDRSNETLIESRRDESTPNHPDFTVFWGRRVKVILTGNCESTSHQNNQEPHSICCLFWEQQRTMFYNIDVLKYRCINICSYINISVYIYIYTHVYLHILNIHYIYTYKCIYI